MMMAQSISELGDLTLAEHSKSDNRFFVDTVGSWGHCLIAMIGIGVPNPLGAQRRNLLRFFCAVRSSFNGGLGGTSYGKAGSKWPVRQSCSVRLHVIGVARRRVCNPHLESDMSSLVTGEIRPSSEHLVQAIISADSAVSLLELILKGKLAATRETFDGIIFSLNNAVSALATYAESRTENPILGEPKEKTTTISSS
jgi:hypothetical protein